MTKEELKAHCKKQIENCEIMAAYKGQEPHGKIYEEHKLILELLEQEPSRDMEEIKEVINCDADAETKCKMISDILTAKSHYFEEPFINKPCVSSEVCEHDKNKVLDNIIAEIAEPGAIRLEYKITGKRDKDIEDLVSDVLKQALKQAKKQVLDIIDKHKTER